MTGGEQVRVGGVKCSILLALCGILAILLVSLFVLLQVLGALESLSANLTEERETRHDAQVSDRAHRDSVGEAKACPKIRYSAVVVKGDKKEKKCQEK